jgi:hypothetical protein
MKPDIKYCLTLVLLFGAALSLGAVVNGQGKYGAAREIINRVNEDLRRASDDARQGNKGKDERDRVDKAQHRLSDVDQKLSKGKFDKGKLDDLISSVRDVVEHNTLAPPTRDALRADISDLERLRSAKGNL